MEVKHSTNRKVQLKVHTDMPLQWHALQFQDEAGEGVRGTELANIAFHVLQNDNTHSAPINQLHMA